MPVDRRAFRASAQRYFRDLDRWQLTSPAPNLFRDLLPASEIELKATQYRELLAASLQAAQGPVDYQRDWDQVCYSVFDQLQTAALYYLFTGDARAVAPTLAALGALEQCPRPYWTYSSCLGVLDMDLRTADVALSLALTKCCMNDALAPDVHRRMTRLMVDRCLAPGLAAERAKTYPWMASRANWRIILCGCFALGGMAFADDFPEYRELMEYGLEGVLVALEDGDRAGGWDEGPGYWDYGLSYAVRLAFALRTFTGGQVDLFRHPFLRKTGDFRLWMQPQLGRLWNWSDAGKQAGTSLTIVGLARACQEPAYQEQALAQGVKSLWQLYLLDPHLASASPRPQPLAKLFPDLGVLVLRSGFGPRDAYIGFKAGNIPHLNYHSHLDQGGLVIHAEGRELLAELDKWPYPYEGDRTADGKKTQPGFYDEELKRWKRRDFDDVGALGHNLVLIEGEYPQPRTGVKARFLHTEFQTDYDVAVVDSTGYYRPLARRVRRYLVYLHPDVVLLVDEVRARQPVQARVLYHYLPEEPATDGVAVEWGADTFTFSSGPARLYWRSLYPAVSDHLVLGREERRTTYQPPAGLAERRNQYLYVQNLYRKPRVIFVAALQSGAADLARAEFALQGNPGREDVFGVVVHGAAGTRLVQVNLARVQVRVRQETTFTTCRSFLGG